MKVIDPGHEYELEGFEGTPQVLTFIKKEAVPESSTGQVQTVYDGTTNEEVLKVLIDRLEILNGRFPCVENKMAVKCLETALEVLKIRTASRKLRGVEGKHLK